MGRFVHQLLWFFLVLFATFDCGFSALGKKNTKSKGGVDGFGYTSVVLPVSGNVYPKGYYNVIMNIGNPPKPYSLDVDTGSDLTWLQCDAPCSKCTPAPHTLYKPSNDLIMCVDPLCASLYYPENNHCDSPNEQCDYEVEYADQGSSMGVLVKDSFSLKFTNGSTASPRLAFGCGYNQEVPDSIHPPYTDGVIGLGNGKSSFVGQLSNIGLTRNVIGHCLSSKGGGFLFFGDDHVPSSGIVWTPILSSSTEKHYSLGPADLHFNGQTTGLKGLPIVFDSGSTYSYLSSQAYDTFLSQLKSGLNGKALKDANEDKTLPICWKGSKSFKSIRDVEKLFKPITLSFTKSNVQLLLPPEAYLVITDRGNVCLGILNGSEVGLGNLNIIGDISLQDKMVVYDNEKQQIGWVTASCDKLPKFSV